MTLRLACLCIALVAGGLLPAGCRFVSPRKAAGARASESDSALARRAAAHAHFAQGVLEQAAGRGAEAMEQFHLAARLDPGDEDLVIDVARRWLILKKPDRALEILRPGAEQAGSSVMMDVLLGTAYAETGRTNLATEASLRAIRKAPHLLAGYQSLFRGHWQGGRKDDAFHVLDTAAQRRGTDAEFLIGLAELYLNVATEVPSAKSSAHVKALSLLQRADAMTVTNIESRLRLADAFNAVGRADRAAELFQAMLEEHPHAPMLQEAVRAKLADIYLRGKNRKRAISQLEAMVRESPMNVQAHYQLALLESEDGNAARAAEHFGTVVVLNPKFEQAYYDLAIAQLSLDRTNEAMAALETAQKKFGQNFVSEFLLGLTGLRAGEFDEAVRRFTSAEIIARATDPKHLTPLFYHQFGAALERHGDYSGAVRYLEKALELKPDFPEAANHLGYMWAERGENLERARELIDRAVRADPNNDAYLDSQAWVLFKQGKSREALPVMRQAIAIAEAKNKPDPALYDHLGDICIAIGDVISARFAWEQALKLAPSEEIRKKLDRVNTP